MTTPQLVRIIAMKTEGRLNLAKIILLGTSEELNQSDASYR